MLTPGEFQNLGLPSPAQNPEQGDVMLVARPHFAFSSRVDADQVLEPVTAGGSHGHLPNHKRSGAVFIAWGNGIKPGTVLPAIEAVDVTPTVAKILGLQLEKRDGRVLKEILSDPF